MSNDLVVRLSAAEINSILHVLGDLPSKTGASPLIVKIKEQAEEQLPKPESQESTWVLTHSLS